KRIDSNMPWPFFIALDFESMDKYALFREDSVFVKFDAEIIKPNTSDSLVLDFEMDPGKDVRFSSFLVATIFLPCSGSRVGCKEAPENCTRHACHHRKLLQV